MPLPAPTFGNYHFFPLAFEKIESGKRFRTESPGNDQRAVFFALQKNGLWTVTLGGLKILEAFIDDWDAFVDAIKGGWKPCLFRQESKRFKILKNQPGGIGTGDGVTTQFQLSKSKSYQYGPAPVSRETVRFPHHNYPQMVTPVGNGAGTITYPAGELVRVWVDGVEMPWLSGWDIDRETGAITFDVAPHGESSPGAGDAALIQAECRFWVLMHGQDLWSLALTGGTYQLTGGATLRQMPGEMEINGEAS